MSYQIIAEVELEDANDPRAKRLSLSSTRIREAGFDGDECIQHFDIRGDWDRREEDTLWFCERLVKAGFFNFSIRHSY